jgi:hypothetical protein
MWRMHIQLKAVGFYLNAIQWVWSWLVGPLILNFEGNYVVVVERIVWCNLNKQNRQESYHREKILPIKIRSLDATEILELEQ